MVVKSQTEGTMRKVHEWLGGQAGAKGKRRLWRWFYAVVCLLGLGLCFFCVCLFVLQRFEFINFDATDTWLGPAFIFSLPFLVMSNWVQRKKTFAEAAHAILFKEPFVLYLRSFELDQGFATSLKKYLGEVSRLLVFGPIYLLFQPKHQRNSTPLDIGYVLKDNSPYPAIASGAKGIEVGLPKIPLDDSNWRQVVRELIEQSACVVFTPIDSPGTKEEFKWICVEFREKTVVVVLPDYLTKWCPGYSQNYERFRHHFSSMCDLPAWVKSGWIFNIREAPEGSTAIHGVPFAYGPRLSDYSDSALISQIRDIGSAQKSISNGS